MDNTTSEFNSTRISKSFILIPISRAQRYYLVMSILIEDESSWVYNISAAVNFAYFLCAW
jgi:hypothetical protein